MANLITENGRTFVLKSENENRKKNRNVEILERFDTLRKENPDTPCFTLCRFLSSSYDLEPRGVYAIVKKNGRK